MQTTEKEVFQTPGWNLVGCDREIEAILRTLPPHSHVVVRNRMGHVLATVAGLKDLATLAPMPLTIDVPENALQGNGLDVTAGVTEASLHAVMAHQLYNLADADTTDSAPSGSVLVALGFTAEHTEASQRLAEWAARHPEVPFILLLPPGASLAAPLRDFGDKAWSAGFWAGFNAFSLPWVEEAIAELDPKHILVAAAHPSVLTYTGVGALDFWLRRSRMDATDGLFASRRVTLLRFATAAPVHDGPPLSVLDAIKRHLIADLGVTSTEPDLRFRASEEAVAIDLL